MPSLTRKQLLAAQQARFPGSTPLTNQEAINWACNTRTYAESQARLAWVAMSLQYASFLFYYTARGEVGCRYGLDDGDYRSGAPALFHELTNTR